MEGTQFFVVVECILLVLSLRLAGHVLSTNMLNDVAYKVVLATSQFSATPDNDFVSTFAKVLFIMNLEVFAFLGPE